MYNYTNGIGGETRKYLDGISFHHDELTKAFGEVALFVISPTYDPNTYGFDAKLVDEARRITRSTGGDVFFCPYKMLTDEFWDVDSWSCLCAGASAKILELSRRFDQHLVIAIDQPFLNVPRMVQKASKTKIDCIIALYGSSYIREGRDSNPKILSWEHLGVSSARQLDNIWLGDICETITSTLISHYGARRQDFAPLRSSLFLGHNDFLPFSEHEKDSVLRFFNIPRDRSIILCFGSAETLKGFDTLLESMNEIRARVHLVLIAVGEGADDPLLQKYTSLIQRNGISCTLIGEFTRDLPKALCQDENTRIVVHPSVGDSFSDIPHEVAVWARDGGPVVLTSDIWGFREQIDDGVNGFKFSRTSPNSIAEKLSVILQLDEARLRTIRKRAYERVVTKYDFRRSLFETLNYFWRSG